MTRAGFRATHGAIATFILAVLLSTGLLGPGCGTGSSSLQEYFEQMHASPSVESKIRVLEANFRASLRDSPPEADALEALRIFLAGAVDVERQIVDELQAITPTESVAMEHDRLIEVHHALQTSLMEVVEDLKGVSTVVEARPIIEPVMAAAEQQLDLACEGLANIAMREHIQIDWTCLGTVDWSEVV